MLFNFLKHTFSRKIAKINIMLWLLGIVMSLSAHTLANESDEYTLKSAFLYNFSLFTTWPEQDFTTFNLCIYGDDPFGKAFDVLLQDKKINHRSITIHRLTQRDQLTQCQLVFISRSEMYQITEIVNHIADYPVLTIADSSGASLQGVMLNMIVKNDRITFEANLTQAKKAGLHLSAQLLRLATEVY